MISVTREKTICRLKSKKDQQIRLFQNDLDGFQLPSEKKSSFHDEFSHFYHDRVWDFFGPLAHGPFNQISPFHLITEQSTKKISMCKKWWVVKGKFALITDLKVNKHSSSCRAEQRDMMRSIIDFTFIRLCIYNSSALCDFDEKGREKD